MHYVDRGELLALSEDVSRRQVYVAGYDVHRGVTEDLLKRESVTTVDQVCPICTTPCILSASVVVTFVADV